MNCAVSQSCNPVANLRLYPGRCAGQEVIVQTFTPELAVEAFDVRVLNRFAWLTKRVVMYSCPQKQKGVSALRHPFQAKLLDSPELEFTPYKLGLQHE